MKRWLMVVVLSAGCAAQRESPPPAQPYRTKDCSVLGPRALEQFPFKQTGQALDVAITSPGYFLPFRERDSLVFSRLGLLAIDSEGYLTNGDGLHLIAFPEGSDQLGDLFLGTAISRPAPTSLITLRGNLNSRATIESSTIDWTRSPSAITSVTVYDKRGHAETVDLYWLHTDEHTWEFHALSSAAEVARGRLDFTSSGRLLAVFQESAFFPGSEEQPLRFDFGDALEEGGTGLNGFTHFDSPSAMRDVIQNGNAFGVLSSLQIDLAGYLIGGFTNGQQRELGRLALANFPTARELRRLSKGSLVMATEKSGQPVFGKPLEQRRPAVVSGGLETLPEEDEWCLETSQ